MVKTKKSNKPQTRRKAKFPRKPAKASMKMPTASSLVDDIREINRAIANLKKVANMTGMRSILTSLYGEKRFAENLLRTKYPKLVRARSGNAEKNAVWMKQAASRRRSRRTPTIPITITTTKSQKLKRGWRFIDAVKKNYSNDPTIAKMSKKQLRSEFKRFRQGRKTRVPDIAWYNPSP